MDADLYAILGVGRDADDEIIRAAYRALAKRYHPDTADDEAQTTERFRQIAAAYDVLRDSGRRALYDLRHAREQAADQARRQRAPAVGRPPASSAQDHPLDRVHPRLDSLGTALMVVGICGSLAAIAVAASHQNRSDRAFGPRDAIHAESLEQNANRRESVGAAGPALNRATGSPANSVALEEEERRQSRQAYWRQLETFARIQMLGAHGIAGDLPTDNASKTEPVERSSGPEATQTLSIYPATCLAADGRRFSITGEGGVVGLSYNGGSPVHPSTDADGTYMVMLSHIEPQNRISIGFMRGKKDGAVFVSDANGNVVRTIGAKCSAAPF
jgi:curved DNA-binding protein CbpA